MKNRIVTISREFGSGGRTIGKQLADKLEIHCYDQELIVQLMKESGFAKEYIEEQGEYAPRGRFSNAFAGRGRDGLSNQDHLWIIQKNLIRELAEKESCVIVGRCADYILKEEADCLNVFIYASMEKRAQRIVEVYGDTEKSPETRLRDKDKRRAAYYQFYTEQKWGKVQNYDIALNSGVIGIEKCVDILSDLY